MKWLARAFARLAGRAEIAEISRTAPDARVRAVVLSENLNATYYISFHFVLEELARRGAVQFNAMSQARAHALLQRCGTPELAVREICDRLRPTVVVFSRYGHPGGEQLLRAFRTLGVPCIYHIDDDLLELPPSLGDAVVQTHGSPAVIETRQAMLRGADLVYASTPRLASRLGSRFPDARVVHGEIYAAYMPFLVHQSLNGGDRRDVTIGYMGSKSHQCDLAFVVPAVLEVLTRHPAVRLEVFGTIPTPAAWQGLGGRVTRHSATGDYAAFIERFAAMRWDIGLAPLEDNAFNACKAPTKFVEYTLCGAATIASDVPVYSEHIDGSNGLLASDPASWVKAMDTLVRSAAERSSRLEQARRYCERRFDFGRLCAQVQRILAMNPG